MQMCYSGRSQWWHFEITLGLGLWSIKLSSMGSQTTATSLSTWSWMQTPATAIQKIYFKSRIERLLRPRLIFVRDSSRWGDIVIYFCWTHSQGLPNTAIRRRTNKIFHSLCRLRLSIHCGVIKKTLFYCHKWAFKGGSSIASHLNNIFSSPSFFILSNATCYSLPWDWSGNFAPWRLPRKPER